MICPNFSAILGFLLLLSLIVVESSPNIKNNYGSYGRTSGEQSRKLDEGAAADYEKNWNTDYNNGGGGGEYESGKITPSDSDYSVTHTHSVSFVDHFDNSVDHNDGQNEGEGQDYDQNETNQEEEETDEREFSTRKNKKGRKGKFDLKHYYDVNVMYKWLDAMAEKHKDACQIFSIGRSVQNRTLKLLKIGLPGSGSGKNKPSIFIDGGIHAREWASPTTAVYMIYELLSKRTGLNKKILSNVDVYIIPMLNPDGYSISRNGRSRMWRKNGRKNSGGGGCNGVDLNRNFGYKFGGPGSDTNPCSEIYRGTKAFSEPETRALRDFVEKNKVNWKLYLSLHTYGQAILTPWGFTYDLPKDYKELKALGDKAAAAIKKVHGTSYRVGTATALFGPAAGCSDDWAKGSGHFKYSYTMELRDMGRLSDHCQLKSLEPKRQDSIDFIDFTGSDFSCSKNNYCTENASFVST